MKQMVRAFAINVCRAAAARLRTPRVCPVNAVGAKYDSLMSRAAKRSAEAYVEPVSQDSILISDPMTDAQAVITLASGDEEKEEPSRITVAFRGTTSHSDWLADVWLPLQPLPSPHRKTVKAHTGFLRQYMSIHGHILHELQRGGARHVVLTGHSLGGALAVIAAAMLPPTYTYDIVTFGAPRAGNRELQEAAYFKCRSCVRVVHDLDIVPLVPSEFLGFKHVCEPWILLDAEGALHSMPCQMSFWQQAYLRTRGMMTRDFGIKDHFMCQYMRGVGQEMTSDDQNTLCALEMQTFPTEPVAPTPGEEKA